ncbi:GreA/GreB family elongation factor [Mucilaginibacter agri]|uniref:3-oxoacyl-ACP synthase n=1 Tax=Mucilaginibacter agri TaxID=2695265 RepID=A0A965ZEI3_9SPHI|nr:3-oxoacyl-ACP synthase [Mucilaginibacter agri]NCD68758.1 3-oxoacyl-ACP synthase [Mucilaginibacter agri]
MNNLKQLLHQQCANYINIRIGNAQQAIDEAQQGQQQETKSSAGDKYETGRAMMQQEINRNMAALNEANKLMVALNAISTAGASSVADAGSIVVTNKGNFYLSVSAGTITVDNENYFAVSTASPIGAKLKGKKAGDKFEVNGMGYEVLEVL